MPLSAEDLVEHQIRNQAATIRAISLIFSVHPDFLNKESFIRHRTWFTPFFRSDEILFHRHMYSI